MKQTFLQQVTDELLRRFGWEGLKDVTLVFPMHRAGVVMRSELQARMRAEKQTTVWAPEMIALGDLFDSLCPLGKEDELFTVCRLHRIYTTCVQSHPMEIDRFYGWGRQLLSDFTNIDQGISSDEIDSFFRNALSLSRLDTMKLDPEVRQRLEDLLYKGQAREQSLIAQSVREHFAAMWEALPYIYHQLGDELLGEGKGYEGQRMRYVVEHWQELSSRTDSRTYCFIGFNYLLPVERQLMLLLHQEGRALFFWDYIEDFQTNTKAFAFIRQNMLQLPNALPAAKWGEPRKIRAISATSMHAQAGFAGQWMKQTYRQKGQTTAVVICDEAQLEPVIYSLPAILLGDQDAPEDVNITKGYPMRSTPIYAAVVKLLDKATGDLGKDPKQALQHIVNEIDKLSEKQLKDDQPRTWQWHMRREALYQTRRTIIQFKQIIEEQILSDLTAHPDLLSRLIMRHLEQLTLPFHGEPVTDLQIMGVLETRTLDFHSLLLLNVEEGVIPAHQPDKSFLPYYLRKAYGLQTHDERASVYAYNFFRLLQRAEDVTIVFSQAQTAMTKKTMSRFVMQMLISDREFSIERQTLTESNTLQPIQVLQVPDGASWVSSCEQQGLGLYLSPSAINTYYRCPRKFYLQYMLGLREEDEQEAVYSTRTLGLFVHEALHHLYVKHCGYNDDDPQPIQIDPNKPAAMNTPEQRDEALNAAYEKMNNNYLNDHKGAAPIYLKEQHPVENHVIDTYIDHVLQRDSYDAQHYRLTINLLEGKLYARVSVTEGNTERIVSIGGRADRVDQVGDQVRVIDYKCGKYNAKKMNAKPEELFKSGSADADYIRQTLIYSYVAFHKDDKHPVQPHLYFTSRDLNSKKTITHVSLGGQPIIYNQANDATYAPLVSKLVENIVNERLFTMCDTCDKYCPFLRLCGREKPKY